MSNNGILSSALRVRGAEPSFNPIGNAHASQDTWLANGTGHTASERMKAAGKLNRVSQSMPDQVKLLMSERYQFLGQFPTRRVALERCKRIASLYRELDALGYKLDDVTTLGLRHARALLENWKSKGLSHKTIKNRWSTLCSWALALGKHGMLGPIEQQWPEFVTQAFPVRQTRVLSESQIAQRSAYLATKPDLTTYLVERFTREARMTREDALALSLVAAKVVVAGHSVMSCGNGATAHVYRDMTKHHELMQEAVAFMVSRNRQQLIWPDLDMQTAIEKYAVRMSYVNRQLFPKTATVEVGIAS